MKSYLLPSWLTSSGKFRDGAIERAAQEIFSEGHAWLDGIIDECKSMHEVNCQEYKARETAWHKAIYYAKDAFGDWDDLARKIARTPPIQPVDLLYLLDRFKERIGIRMAELERNRLSRIRNHIRATENPENDYWWRHDKYHQLQNEKRPGGTCD
jgi:hypothetical protein